MIFPKKSNGPNEEQITEAINLFTSSTARLTRLIIEGNDAETKRQASNHLRTLKWAIEQLAQHPNSANYTFFLQWLKELGQFGKDMMEIMREEEASFLIMMSERYK